MTPRLWTLNGEDLAEAAAAGGPGGVGTDRVPKRATVGRHATGAPVPDSGTPRYTAVQETAGPVDPSGLESDQGGEGLAAAADGSGGSSPEGAPFQDVEQSGTSRNSPDESGAIRIADQSGSLRTADQPESVPGPDQEEAPGTPTAAPARKARTVPKPAGEGLPVPLWGDVIMKVYPEARGTYPIEILKGGTRICIEAPRSPPWLSTKLQDTLITGLTAAVEEEGRSREFVKRKVGEAFTTIAERLETDDETRRALTPAPVRRIIEETESVIVYPGEATFYEVTIRGRTLTITAAQMARVESGFINAAVLNAFPLDPLDASKGDWKAIKDYWLSPDVAEVRDREETSEAEIVIERLRAHCEGLTLVASPEALTADTLAWNDEAKGLVWVTGTRIARFIEEELKKPPEFSAALSKILRAEGGPMPRPTKPIRIGPSSKLVRCWGLKEEFARFKSPGGGMRVRDAITARREDP